MKESARDKSSLIQIVENQDSCARKEQNRKKQKGKLSIFL